MLRGRIGVAGFSDVRLMNVMEVAGVGRRFNGRTLVTGIRHRLDEDGWRTDVQFGLSAERFVERSGIADFVTELLPYLAAHFRIDLFASPDVDAERYRAMGFAVHPWQTLPATWLDYDGGVVYQFGNSSFHAHMLPLLRMCPGTVFLHDVYLSGLMAQVKKAQDEKPPFVMTILEAEQMREVEFDPNTGKPIRDNGSTTKPASTLQVPAVPASTTTPSPTQPDQPNLEELEKEFGSEFPIDFQR